MYCVHQTICFGTMMKLPIFISFKLLKLGCYKNNFFITVNKKSKLPKLFLFYYYNNNYNIFYFS